MTEAKFTYNVKIRGLHCYRRPLEGEEESKSVVYIVTAARWRERRTPDEMRELHQIR